MEKTEKEMKCKREGYLALRFLKGVGWSEARKGKKKRKMADVQAAMPEGGSPWLLRKAKEDRERVRSWAKKKNGRGSSQ